MLAASRSPNGAETAEGHLLSRGSRRDGVIRSGRVRRRSILNYGQKKGPPPQEGEPNRCAGGDVLSHRVPPAVPSARQSLTTVFEMGTGVSSALRPPATSMEAVKQASSKQG